MFLIITKPKKSLFDCGMRVSGGDVRLRFLGAADIFVEKCLQKVLCECESPLTPFFFYCVWVWVCELLKRKLNPGMGPTLLSGCLAALRMNWLLTLHCLSDKIQKLIKGCGELTFGNRFFWSIGKQLLEIGWFVEKYIAFFLFNVN